MSDGLRELFEYFADPSNWGKAVLKQSQAHILRILMELQKTLIAEQESTLEKLNIPLVDDQRTLTVGLAPIRVAAQQYLAKADAEADWIDFVNDMISRIDELTLQSSKLERLLSVHRQPAEAV